MLLDRCEKKRAKNKLQNYKTTKLQTYKASRKKKTYRRAMGCTNLFIDKLRRQSFDCSGEKEQEQSKQHKTYKSLRGVNCNRNNNGQEKCALRECFKRGGVSVIE